MAQNGAMNTDRRNAADAARVNAKDNANATANGAGNGAAGNGSGTPLQGANADLLMNMMNCVDTSLFSPQQLISWEQMKQRIRSAVDHNVPLIVPTSISEHLAKSAAASSASSGASTTSSGDSNTGGGGNVDFRQPLHREASIQDVLSCLLDQQPPSMRVIASNGGNVLVNSELKNRLSGGAQSEEHRPTLKSLLSSNDFTMTEKKESLKHLLSFIDNSFASHPEPMTDVYKESQDGNMRRLSSLHMMRSFLTPNTNMQSMGGRTTSFEIIQSMLNATTNQTIQKPMTSQDSFRFQHLANVLEAIEGDVGYDNEDYGGEEVVQVDNLDNLLDYQSPTHAQQQQQQQQQQSHHGATSGGFVDTQSMVNQSSRLGGGIAGGYSNEYASGGYQNLYGGQQLYGNSAQLPAYGTTHHQNAAEMANMMYANVKVEPTTPHHQSMMSHDSMQQSSQPPYGHMSFQSAMLAAQPDMMMGGTPSAYHSQQTASMMKPASMQHQQYSAMLMQQQQQQLQQLQHQQTPMHGQAASLVKQQKQDAHGGVQICSALGCNHVARVKGMCKLHGGGRRCKVEGCMKSAQTGHLCIAHGGGKPCNVEGCPKTAQSRGLCKQHGGGVRCKFEGCTKSCQSGGYCRGHGGGKRCEFPNCTKWAQKNGHCAKHAQEITQHHP